MTIYDELNRLADLQSQADVIRLSYQEMRDSVLSPEQVQTLEDINAEEQTALEALEAGITQLTADVKQTVLFKGETAKGDHLQAVWMKGRTSWDTKALKGYAVSHPEITVLQKTGKPSVSIRKV